jgi:heme iron utilization protein
VLSTISTAASTSGFPLGSIVEYGLDAQGRPILSLSSLSGHTRDIRADPRCSLTVTSPGFRVVMKFVLVKHAGFVARCLNNEPADGCKCVSQGMSDARFTLIGRVQPVSDAEEAAAREAYMSRNPGSFWVCSCQVHDHVLFPCCNGCCNCHMQTHIRKLA